MPQFKTGNISVNPATAADLFLITTNGTLKNAATTYSVGAGVSIARQAKERFPVSEAALGRHIQALPCVHQGVWRLLVGPRWPAAEASVRVKQRYSQASQVWTSSGAAPAALCAWCAEHPIASSLPSISGIGNGRLAAARAVSAHHRPATASPGHEFRESSSR